MTSRIDVPGTAGAPVHDHPVTDDEPAPTSLTVCDRLTASGLSDERIEQHLTAGRVRVDGEARRRPGRSAPAGTRVALWAE